MSYLEKFLPSTAEVCKPSRKLKSLKCKWTWNSTYQNLYDYVTMVSIMKKHIYVGCQSSNKSSARKGQNVVPIEASTSQCSTAISSFTSAEVQYNDMRETPTILHGLEMFHHLCFTFEVFVIIDHKPNKVLQAYHTGTMNIFTNPSVQHIYPVKAAIHLRLVFKTQP